MPDTSDAFLFPLGDDAALFDAGVAIGLEAKLRDEVGVDTFPTSSFDFDNSFDLRYHMRICWNQCLKKVA
jgi:hypothetical protein